MEKQHKINLEAEVSYSLHQDELKKMYLSLALLKYRCLRNPNYREQTLFKLLSSDLKKFLAETQSLMQKMPNNHSLYKFHVFFDHLYTNLKAITKETKQEVS